MGESDWGRILNECTDDRDREREGEREEEGEKMADERMINWKNMYISTDHHYFQIRKCPPNSATGSVQFIISVRENTALFSLFCSLSLSLVAFLALLYTAVIRAY